MRGSRIENGIESYQMVLREGSFRLSIRIGTRVFIARSEEQLAPRTCELFRKMLPLRSSILHCRWSGESMWIPFESQEAMAYENHTSHPIPGQILLYAQGFSEPEILMPYGACTFSSKVGQLAGNHFLTLAEGAEELRDLGRTVLWEGAQDILFELLD